MPTSLQRTFASLVLLTCTFLYTSAQDAQEPTGKILEVHSKRNPQPSIIALYRERFNGFWASGYPRLKDWKAPPTGDPIQALDFKAQLVGDKCELIISTLSGKRFGENVEPIARVSIADGDTVVVSELMKFGFDPVTVRLRSILTAVADVPFVTNPASGLRTEVSNIVATLPTFKIKFMNDSGKDIMAFDWYTEAGGKKLRSAIAQGRFGKALIEANGSYEMNINANRRDGDPNPVTMVIVSVVYRDGSVDGDRNSASTFLAFTEGRKKALEQIVPILQKEAEKTSGRTDLVSVKSKIDALTDGVSPSTAAGIAFEGTITELLDSLRKIDIQAGGKSDSELGSAFREITTSYREWLARMKQ